MSSKKEIPAALIVVLNVLIILAGIAAIVIIHPGGFL
jgi:hypothetical protein